MDREKLTCVGAAEARDHHEQRQEHGGVGGDWATCETQRRDAATSYERPTTSGRRTSLRQHSTRVGPRRRGRRVGVWGRPQKRWYWTHRANNLCLRTSTVPGGSVRLNAPTLDDINDTAPWAILVQQTREIRYTPTEKKSPSNRFKFQIHTVKTVRLIISGFQGQTPSGSP